MIGCIGHDGDCCKDREQDLKDAERYRWLKARLLGADFDWNESGTCALVFEWPKDSPVSANCDRTIDDAMIAAETTIDGTERDDLCAIIQGICRKAITKATGGAE